MSARAYARTTDPVTAHGAARSVTRIGVLQGHIVRLIALHGPMTDEELVSRARREGLRDSESSIRSRRSELVHQLVLKDTGTKRLTTHGRPALVWGFFWHTSIEAMRAAATVPWTEPS